MSYVNINGKRYYKDERTGRVTLDNVSQAEAEQRALRNRVTGGTSGVNIPWKALMTCVVIALFIGAFCYNRTHVSTEEQAITNYMNAQQTISDTAEDETISGENNQDTNLDVEAAEEESDLTSSDYLIADSADRYLEASDIEGRSHDEIQLIINEIYARHGREFHTQENINYFSARDWYTPVSGKSDEAIASEFNEFEKANVELLCEFL